jgi:hypothetical protein
VEGFNQAAAAKCVVSWQAGDRQLRIAAGNGQADECGGAHAKKHNPNFALRKKACQQYLA